MKFIACLVILLPFNVFSQEVSKDTRSLEKKQDPLNSYNAENINKITLLKALEMAGVNIFYIPLNKFDKKYQFEITLDEFVDSKKVNSKKISISDNNQYVYYKNSKKRVAYIDHLNFYSKEIDTASVLKIETYAGSIGGIKLTQKKTRPYQQYYWRSYNKTNWIVGKNIPVLVLASSWYDKKYDVERFCGTEDLSRDEEETKLLLENSPHYYQISYKISDY